MKTRPLAFAVAALLLLQTTGAFASDTKRNGAKKAAAAARLVGMLPASDGVAVFETRRFLTDGLPRILSSNQPALAEITARLDEMTSRTGIDLRRFDQVAVGIAVKQISETECDLEPVVVAGGEVSANALLTVAKLAAKGSYREEKVAGRTLYVFSPTAAAQRAAGVTISNSKVAAMADKALRAVMKEIAVAAFDGNTLVMGPEHRVRETLEARTKVSTEVVSLLPKRDTAVLSFAMLTTPALVRMLPFDTSVIGNTADSVRYMAGSFDVNGTGAALQVMARTQTAAQAAEVKDLIDVGTSLGKFALGNAAREDKKVYGRMLANMTTTVRGSDITIDLAVPQADIDVLLANVK